MKTLCLIMLAAVFTFAAMPSAQTPADHTADALAINKLLAAYQAAYNKHDARATAALYAVDGDRRTIDGRVVNGREAIEKQLTDDFNGRLKSAVVTFDTSSVMRYVGGDMAIVDGSAQLSGTRYFHTIVMVKRGGTWQVLALRNWAAPAP